jgi:H+/Cl- antiporter ClcA
MEAQIKKFIVVAAAGAVTGLTGAVAVDWAEFKKYLAAKDFDGAVKHIRMFDLGAALPRYWRGIYGGAMGAVLAFAGLDGLGGFGIELPQLGA